MTTEEFIAELFYRVDEAMTAVPKHPQASLWPEGFIPPLAAERPQRN
jgi:hypothetical protein